MTQRGRKRSNYMAPPRKMRIVRGCCAQTPVHNYRSQHAHIPTAPGAPRGFQPLQPLCLQLSSADCPGFCFDLTILLCTSGRQGILTPGLTPVTEALFLGCLLLFSLNPVPRVKERKPKQQATVYPEVLYPEPIQ